MPSFDMERVVSSNVRSIGYDPEEATLAVEFLDGSLYYYYDVEEDIFHQFLLAPSKGRFVWRALRDVYDYERIV